jgi:hypothetical protein
MLRGRGYTFSTVSELILNGGTTQRAGRALPSKTRVDDVSDDIGALYGDATEFEDYGKKLRDYKLDFPGTKLQRLLNRTRVKD